ncbi:hypothetical protein BX070DRAFT_226046 [Coemansia spiralis]|nr:hypothetical protein BX070DRAFT_226046 [Coemansia spiralis]
MDDKYTATVAAASAKSATIIAKATNGAISLAQATDIAVDAAATLLMRVIPSPLLLLWTRLQPQPPLLLTLQLPALPILLPLLLVLTLTQMLALQVALLLTSLALKRLGKCISGHSRALKISTIVGTWFSRVSISLPRMRLIADEFMTTSIPTTDACTTTEIAAADECSNKLVRLFIWSRISAPTNNEVLSISDDDCIFGLTCDVEEFLLHLSAKSPSSSIWDILPAVHRRINNSYHKALHSFMNSPEALARANNVLSYILIY